MIIWGAWQNTFDEPVLLNIDEEDGPLEASITEMVTGDDYCIFLTEEGRIYAMGTDDKGMLGLGKDTHSTN